MTCTASLPGRVEFLGGGGGGGRGLSPTLEERLASARGRSPLRLCSSSPLAPGPPARGWGERGRETKELPGARRRGRRGRPSAGQHGVERGTLRRRPGARGPTLPGRARRTARHGRQWTARTALRGGGRPAPPARLSTRRHPRPGRELQGHGACVHIKQGHSTALAERVVDSSRHPALSRTTLPAIACLRGRLFKLPTPQPSPLPLPPARPICRPKRKAGDEAVVAPRRGPCRRCLGGRGRRRPGRAPVFFQRLPLPEPLDWCAGSGLFPARVMSGLSAPFDNYTADGWSGLVKRKCAGLDRCSSAVSFLGGSLSLPLSLLSLLALGGRAVAELTCSPSAHRCRA